MDAIVRRRALSRLMVAMLVLLALLVAGTAGYRLLEGMSLVDALYMTVITISTVGFGEINPLGPMGRLFTIGLILAGAALAAFSLSIAVDVAISSDLRSYFEHRRRQAMLANLSAHTIICGYGRMGRHVADELHLQRRPFVVIDPKLEKIERVRQTGYLALQGNGANEADLRTAGIARARSLVATANSDAENVFIVLTARSLRPDMVIVARANYDDSEEKLLRAGATRVIQPYRLSGRRMAAVLERPGVADFLDEVMHAGNLELLIDQVDLCPGAALAGQTLGAANLRSRLGITVLALRVPGGRFNTSPGANTLLEPGLSLIALGTPEQLQALAALARAS
ncbi:MAG: potassium channel protein [Chloroflexales bacterium]|nr:potassium channel protein [Chloroflexales bacterium]